MSPLVYTLLGERGELPRLVEVENNAAIGDVPERLGHAGS